MTELELARQELSGAMLDMWLSTAAFLLSVVGVWLAMRENES